MRAELRNLTTIDGDDLSRYSPPNPNCFAISVRILVGPSGGVGQESFDVVVCTAAWLGEYVRDNGILAGRHYLIVNNFDHGSLKSFIEKYIRRFDGESWDEVADKIGRLGRWEFEDY